MLRWIEVWSDRQACGNSAKMSWFLSNGKPTLETEPPSTPGLESTARPAIKRTLPGTFSEVEVVEDERAVTKETLQHHRARPPHHLTAKTGGHRALPSTCNRQVSSPAR